MRPDLSVCMIVKNEEHCIRRCLDSVRPLGAELIVVDTGSTDATPTIAASYGADVSGFDFSYPDFSAARNQSLARAHGRWIMVIDADETLWPSSIPLLQGIAACNDNVACCVRRHNRSAGVSNSSIDQYIRLFPGTRGYRFKFRVHEVVDDSVRAGGAVIVRTDVCIDHDFASDLNSRQRRNLWYMQILEEEVEASPGDLSRHWTLACAYRDLGMFDRAVQFTERIVQKWPSDPDVHLDAGVCYLYYGGVPTRACTEFRESLRLRPNNQAALGHLSVAEMSVRLGMDPKELRAPDAS